MHFALANDGRLSAFCQNTKKSQGELIYIPVRRLRLTNYSTYQVLRSQEGAGRELRDGNGFVM